MLIYSHILSYKLYYPLTVNKAGPSGSFELKAYFPLNLYYYLLTYSIKCNQLRMYHFEMMVFLLVKLMVPYILKFQQASLHVMKTTLRFLLKNRIVICKSKIYYFYHLRLWLSNLIRRTFL